MLTTDANDILLRLYCGMEEKAFEQQATELMAKSVATCISYGANQMLAEDIAQNVLIKLWQMHKELDRYKSIESLVVVMSRNELISHHRRDKTISLSDIKETNLHSIGNEPDQQLISSQELSWLEDAMHRLPSTQYAVLQMRQVEHRSFDEIAQILGIENSSARSLLSRARMWLLQEIKKRDSI